MPLAQVSAPVQKLLSSHPGTSGPFRKGFWHPLSGSHVSGPVQGFWSLHCNAVPALGPAYGLETLVDESLLGVPEVWFEAGDHTTLVRVSGAAFRTLMEQARVAAISEPR